MKKQRLAIVGSGISGMGCAHYLHEIYDITIFEKNDYPGGHTHTHVIHEGDKSFTIDTGFMVFNNETYPHLLKLFKELGIEKQKSDMSFSVWNELINLQYCSSSISQLFAQKKNLFSLQFRRFLFDIQKFFKVAKKDLSTIHENNIGIQAYCLENGIGQYFVDNFLVPMSAAVRSTPHEKVYDFPIALLLPFFKNHGLLGVGEQFQRYTVAGGSDMYTKKILEHTSIALYLEESVINVFHKDDGVELVTQKARYKFDKVIMACHADTSVRLVTDLPEKKKEMLQAFVYNDTLAVLHTDTSIMPPNKQAWASWNQTIRTKENGMFEASTIYRINTLQKPDTEKNYFVSINPYQKIDPKKIVKNLPYHHPLFTLENFALQATLQEVNKDTNIYFTGSYFRYGFHEDGLMSGVEVVKLLTAR